jgi:hypothetical protein
MLATTITIITTVLVTLGIGVQLFFVSRLGTSLLRNKLARAARCQPTGTSPNATQPARVVSAATPRVARAWHHRARSYRVALHSGRRRAGQPAGV